MKRFLIALLVGFFICMWFDAMYTTATEQTKAAPIVTPMLKAPTVDTRASNLQKFFANYKCPTPYYVDDYLKYADEFNLDYRLLPAISIAESTCGEHACGDNRWGWQSCRGIKFSSVPEGIGYVAEALANNHYYRGKSNYLKLRAYNPNPAYATKVLKLMNQIK